MTAETARIVPLPWGPGTEADVFPMHADETFVLPVNVAEPEAMLALHSYLWREDDHATFDEYIVEDPPVARTHECAEILRMANEQMSEVPYMKGVIKPFLREAIADFIEEDLSASAVLDAITPVIQSEIDEVLGQ